MVYPSCHAAAAAAAASGGAPEMLSVLLECESLFNDATSIVLFEIFLHLGTNADAGGGDVSLTGEAWGILKLIGWLSMSGAAAGLLMGITTRCACAITTTFYVSYV
jgi:NhaP-type Na+/H+ or K+/H+ antiporter